MSNTEHEAEQADMIDAYRQQCLAYTQAIANTMTHLRTDFRHLSNDLFDVEVQGAAEIVVTNALAQIDVALAAVAGVVRKAQATS